MTVFSGKRSKRLPSVLNKAVGTITSILSDRGAAIELEVELAGSSARAVAYPPLTGPVSVGDRVLLNTTAVGLSLGTGGYHFVIARLSDELEVETLQPGHVMKLRYTPLQHAVLSVEEEDSPNRSAIDNFTSLEGMPVVIGQIHSQLGPAVAGIKRMCHIPVRVAYCMTDGAALPIAFSRLVCELQSAGLIDVTITAGQAFGGDLEAVNIYTALIAAKEACKVDALIICQGPGNVGTGTEYGYSSIEQGEIINAVNVLGGTAIAIPRVSFADPRARHRGISHHTLTALNRIALTRAVVPLPVIEPSKLNLLEEQLSHSGATFRHKVKLFDGRSAIDELRDKGIALSTMGRSYQEDAEFFLAAAAAGAACAQIIDARHSEQSTG